jgi:predicted deacylase
MTIRTRRAVGALLAAVLLTALTLMLLLKGGGVTATAEASPSQCPEFEEGHGSETVEAYYEPDEIAAFVQRLEATRPSVTTSEIGTSNRGRPIYSVRLGDGDRVVFLQGGIHANEPTGTTALVNLLTKLTDNSTRSQQIREALTIVAIPQLNPDGAVPYQRENDQSWDETVAMFPQLAGAPRAFYHSLPGPRFWSDPRVAGFDLNRDFNPDFGYVPQPGHLPGSGSVRGMYLTPEARSSRDLYTALEEEFGLVDVFVDLHNQAPCNTFDDGHPDTPDLHTPMSISAQFLRDPAAHGAGTTYPNFDWDASRRANVAAWDGTQRGGSTFSGVTRYPQNLNLAGSANGSYQLRGSASVLMEAGRQRHANPQWRHGFIAKVHELGVMGIVDALVDGTFDDIDPDRYEDIPIRD